MATELLGIEPPDVENTHLIVDRSSELASDGTLKQIPSPGRHRPGTPRSPARHIKLAPNISARYSGPT
jgi:hypothetical protein